MVARAAGASGEERDSDRPRSRLLPRSLRLPARARRLRARSQQRSRSVPPERTAGSARHRDAAGRSDGADARAAVAPRRDAQFVTIAHAGFGGEPPVLSRSSEVATRLISGHTLTLDDPLAQRRLDSTDIEFWREAGIHYFVPVRLEGRDDRRDGARAQVERRAAQQRGHGAARRRRRAGRDGARERPALPAAHGQGRRARADARVQREHPRVAERRPRWSSIATTASCAGTAGSKSCTASATKRPSAAGSIRSSDQGFFEVLRSARRESPDGAALYRVPLATRHDAAAAAAGQRGDDAAARHDGRDRRHDRRRRGHFGARAARGAAADLGEDGVDRPARRGRRARGEHAADRHLELRADADAGRPSRTIRRRRCSRRSSARRSARRRSSTGCSTSRGRRRSTAVRWTSTPSSTTCCRCSSTSSRPAASRCARSSRRWRRSCSGIEYKLQQVFLNLFLNARDAMPKGGWLTIVTRVDGENQRSIEVGDTGFRDSARPALAHLRSVLHDEGHRQGHGARPVDHVRHRAGARRHDRVRQRARAGHALHADAAARLGPSAAAVSRQAGSSDRKLMNRTGTILVIDDEEIMREILEALLSREGYDVRLAADAAAGLELARTMPFDAAIVDIMMPGMDGIAALDELKKIDDDLPVLMITAFASVESAITRDEARRVPLHHQAVQERRSAGRAAQRARAAAAGGREPRAAAEPAGAREPLRRDHRPQPADEAGVRPDHPGGAEPDDDPDQRRERHRQGARRARAAPELDARRPRVHHRQLRQPAAGSARVEPLRPREGRVHRRRSTRRRACSSSPTRARSSSTRSATSRSRRRPSCCA